MERFEDRDLTGAEFRESVLDRVRMIGVVMRDAVIEGEVVNLVVNGVEVGGYVETELDRRHPESPPTPGSAAASWAWSRPTPRCLAGPWLAGDELPTVQAALDPTADPTFDEALAERAERVAELTDYLDAIEAGA